MAVRIDQSGQQSPSAAVDCAGNSGKPDELRTLENLADFAVVADRERSEVLELSILADLDAVDVRNQRVGKRGGRQQRHSEREEGLVHGARHSIVRAQVNR
jgi:hypothetical protein